MSSSAPLKLFFVSRYLAFKKSSVNKQLLLLMATAWNAIHCPPNGHNKEKNKLDPGQSLSLSKLYTIQYFLQ